MIHASEIVTGSNTETFADDGVFITVHASSKDAATAGTIAIAHAVKNQLPKVPSDLQKIAEKEQVESTVLYIQETTLFCAVTGHAAVFIKRGNRFATLLQGTRSASGPIQPGDSFISRIRVIHLTFGFSSWQSLVICACQTNIAIFH